MDSVWCQRTMDDNVEWMVKNELQKSYGVNSICQYYGIQCIQGCRCEIGESDLCEFIGWMWCGFFSRICFVATERMYNSRVLFFLIFTSILFWTAVWFIWYCMHNAELNTPAPAYFERINFQWVKWRLSEPFKLNTYSEQMLVKKAHSYVIHRKKCTHTHCPAKYHEVRQSAESRVAATSRDIDTYTLTASEKEREREAVRTLTPHFSRDAMTFDSRGNAFIYGK